MAERTRGHAASVEDLSHGRVPAAIELARQLAEAERAWCDRRAADQRVRACARAVRRRYDHARAVGWTDAQLAAAGLVPPDDIVTVAHRSDTEPDLEPDEAEL